MRPPWSWLIAVLYSAKFAGRKAIGRDARGARRGSGDRQVDAVEILELVLEVLLQPALQAALDLPDALAADAVLVADVLQGERLVGEQALLEDHAILVAQRVAELPDLLADARAVLGVGDLILGGRRGAPERVEERGVLALLERHVDG